MAPGAVVENKRLGAALAFARELQASHPPNRRRAIHDASVHRIIWKHRVCRQRPAHRAKFWQQLQPSETGRVSFQLCTPGDISTLRGHVV